MEEDVYVDVSMQAPRFERAVARLKADPEFSARNKEIILNFLRDGALGKTNPGRGKKRIGPGRQQSYLNYLMMVVRFCQKDLDQVNQRDLEAFVEALEQDRIRSRRPCVAGRGSSVPDGKLLSRCYKAHVKQGIRKFYKWLLGGNKVYPDLVEWIEAIDEWKEITALTEEEAKRMVDLARTVRDRALVQTLFDGGFRLGELLNVRLHHVRRVQLDPADPQARCFMVRVPFSKTLRRTVALPMDATTRWLTLWLEQHPARPQIRSDGTLESQSSNALLFPMPGKRARMIVRKVGEWALNKRVWPHLLRHSSATYWCNRLPYFKFCKRFGWTMTSRMPQRYIDREGVDELDVAATYVQGERARIQRQEDTRASYRWDDEGEPAHADPAPATTLPATTSPRHNVAAWRSAVRGGRV